MSINFFNSIVSWALKKRFHQIELFIKYPKEVQEEVFQELLKKGKKTSFGKTNQFKSINSYRDFQKNVPLHEYENLSDQIDLMRNGYENVLWPNKIKWYAKSSGTTNSKSKFIPVSKESLDDCHIKAGKDMLSIYVNNNPNTTVFAGKTLRLGGSHSIFGENETFYGDLSAILIEHMPFWAEFKSIPNNKISLMDEWEEKLKNIVDSSINEDVRCIAGVPSWMMVLLKAVLEKTGKKNITEVWPNIELFLHGGVSFTPYKEEYKKIIGKEINYYEIYNASEGFFGIQNENTDNNLLLMLDYGIFYEFIPIEDFDGIHSKNIISLKDVEISKTYALVISTNSGLWRYIIGDTIEFSQTDPYKIKIVGRTKHHINVFGEELMINNAEKALSKVNSEFNSSIKEYTAAPVFMETDKKGCHEWVIEFSKFPADFETYKIKFDHYLQEINSDYEAKRYKNITLNPPILHVAKDGLFHEWMKNRNKLGGQNKVPRLSNTREYLDELIDFRSLYPVKRKFKEYKEEVGKNLYYM